MYSNLRPIHEYRMYVHCICRISFSLEYNYIEYIIQYECVYVTYIYILHINVGWEFPVCCTGYNDSIFVSFSINIFDICCDCIKLKLLLLITRESKTAIALTAFG